MNDDDLVHRFWEATLEESEVNHEDFLAEGGEDISAAVRVHQLFQDAAEVWKKPLTPQQLGRFEVVGELGAGGLGRVYLGWDPDLRRHVAIKVIARDRWAINEARSIARLDHRSIVKVHEVGHDRLVMELLDGGTLLDKIESLRERQDSFLTPVRARLHCLVRIAEGLAYCHERGILHRDIKPGNVLFAKDDEHPRLVDFGLAHLDELESLDITQNLVGSPAYLAPEQVESGETGTDRRSDIFSFGVLAYELLTLDSPFRRDTRTATLQAVTEARPRAPRAINDEIPQPVTHILEHCLEPLPGRRYESMHDVVRDLQDAMANRPISVGSRSSAHRIGLYLQRHRRVGAFATAGVGLAGTIGAALWLAGLAGERASFASEMDALNMRVSSLQTPTTIQEAGLDLYNAQSRAEVLDGSWVGRTLFGRESASVAATCETWSRHLIEEIESLSDFENDVFPPDNWRALLQIDARLVGKTPWNEDLTDRGGLIVADRFKHHLAEMLTFRQVPKGPGVEMSIPVLKPVSFARFPQAGLYRVEIPGKWQMEYLIESPWSLPITLDLPRRRLDTTSWYDWEERGLLVSPLISNRLFAAYCDETGVTWTAQVPANGPADVTHVEAMEFARWAGGRLPMGAELGLFCGRGLAPQETRLHAEHVSDLFPLNPLNAGSYFGYEQWEENRTGMATSWLGHQNRMAHVRGAFREDTPYGERVGCGFRLLYFPLQIPPVSGEDE